MRKTFYHKEGRKDSVSMRLTHKNAGGRFPVHALCRPSRPSAQSAGSVPGCRAFGSAHRSLRISLVISALLCLGTALAASVCLAVPGSGTAEIWPKTWAVAGTFSRWTIRYTATEDFDKDGGVVSVQIPSGWSAPQASDSTVVGFLRVTIADPDDLDSVRVSGQTVRVYLAGRPGRFFDAGEHFDLIYGASSSFARTQTPAPDTVEFTVSSEPDGGSPVPLTSGSPSVRVVPGAAVRIAIFFGGSEAGALNLTADDNSSLFSARGIDPYGNVTGGIACTWGLTAPIGVLSGGKDSTNTLDTRKTGTGYVTAYDDFSHTDSTGLITVTHGAYRRLDVAQPDSAVAGSSFLVSVAALDADGNTVTSGTGSNSTLQLSAWLDSLAAVRGSGTFSVGTLNLAAGVGSTAETYLVSESIFARAVDSADTTKSDSGPRPTFVKPAPPVQVELEPDTLHVSAGAQAAFTLTSRDAHGNVSSVSSIQMFYLWKNSPGGEFRQQGGSQQIFEIELPADSTRVSFDYYNTKSQTCQIAAMDVDANSPAFPPATAAVTVTHGPADTLLVSGVSDPFTAGAQSDVAVEVRDGFGNRVTDYSGGINFTSSDVNPGTALPADYSFVPADSGRHVFPLSVTLTDAGEQWVTATDLAVPSVDGTQAGITVLAAGCDTLLLRASENPVSADTWLDLEVEALDEYGNRAASYAGVLRFSSSDKGDSTVLPSDYQFIPADNGLHVFAGRVRLTQAGTQSISARDTSQAGIDGKAVGVSVFAGAAGSVVLFPPGSFQVNAGGTQVLKATVNDAFGNPRSGEPTSVVMKDASDGSLEDDPGNPNNTSGGVTMQTGSTDAAGEITVLYRAPALAGLKDTMDAYCTTVWHGSVADVFILSTPAGATALRILPVEPLADTAAAALSARVEAMDSFGNVDTSETSLVRVSVSSPTARISVDGGASWSAGNSDSLALVAGTTQTRLKVSDTKSGNLALLAEDAGNVLISALKNNVTIRHALPAGAIALSADRDTLIADGGSSAAVAAGPIYDSYGNNVRAGELVTVSVLLCDVVASDMDTSVAGVQLVTGQDGRISFVVKAGTLAGRDTISVESLSGTARGSAVLTLLEAPDVDYVSGTLTPGSVSPGQTIAFSLELENSGGARVYLLPASSFSFSDGNDGTFLATLTDTVIIPTGQRVTAGFVPVLVPPELDAGAYSPLLSLSGFDQTGRAFSQTLSPGPNTVHVVSMSIISILAPLAVSRGAQDVDVQMALRNAGDLALEVTTLGLVFSNPGHTYSLASTTLPDTLAGGETRIFGFHVDVDESTPLGDCTIDGFGGGTTGGISVSDSHADSPAVWVVQSRASLSYVAGSLSRKSVSLGQTHSFSVRLENVGTAAVQLDTAGTSLKFGVPGNEYAASLPAPMLLPGGTSTVVMFRAAQVSATIPSGTYSVEIDVAGVESGAPFADTLSSEPDSVRVELPAVLECLSVSPDTLSTGYTSALRVSLRNSGEATAKVLAQTRVRFGTPPVLYEAFAEDSVLIERDSTRIVDFSPVPVDTSFATGEYGLSLDVRSEENGIQEDTLLTSGSDSVLVQRRACLGWVAASLAPSRVTRGQTVAFVLEVANSGNATAVIEPALCEFSFSDGENEFLASGQGATLVVPARGVASMSFAADTVPANMAAHTYSTGLVLLGVENGSPLSAEVFSPQGELVVQSPPSLRYVAGSLTPRVVAQEQTAGFSLEIENLGDATIFVADTTLLSLGSLTDTIDCASGCQIQGHSTGVVTFKNTKIDSLIVAKGDYPVLVSVIGSDWNGLSFTGAISSAPDSVSVTGPGDLRVNSTVTVSPHAPFVDTLQVFSIEVEVENVGDEKALGVVVSLSSNGGSLITSPVSFGDVDGGARKKLAFNVRAGSATSLEAFTSRIESATGAVSGLPLSVGSALDDTVAVTIQMPALLTVSVSVSEPSGAIDGTVSTDQTFKLRATAENLGQGALGAGGTLRAEIPAGFVLLSPAVQGFVPGVAVEWSVQAPSGAQPAAPILTWVSSIPIALNTGAAADTAEASKTIRVTAVREVELSLDASIVAPVDATDGSLRLDTQFTVQAVASNLGTAAAAGTGRLTLSLPPGYSLAGGQVNEQEFAVGSAVTWDVVSPSASSPIQYLSVRISQPQLDENTNSPASVLVGTRDIAVYAESKQMVAEALPLVEAPDQVAAGDNSVRMMAIRIANPEELGEGSTTGLRALTLYVRGDDNARLSNPSAVVSGVGVWRYVSGSLGAVLGATSAVSANPVRVELSPEADTLGPGEADTLLIVVDVSQSPQAGGIALELDGGSAFEAFERSSGELIAVVSPDGSEFPAVVSAPSRLFAGVHNHPNPFQAGLETTTISYYLANDSRVSLRIFTLDGKPVFSRTFSAEEPQGRHGLRDIEWDGRNGDGRVVLNGVYICRLEAAGVDATFKIAVAK